MLYTIDFPFHLSFAQSIKQNLAKIGLDVEIKGIPLQAYFSRLMAEAPMTSDLPWTPDYEDPYAVLNIQLDGRFIGSTNWPRFDSADTTACSVAQPACAVRLALARTGTSTFGWRARRRPWWPSTI